jgi:hypothetical protein
MDSTTIIVLAVAVGVVLLLTFVMWVVFRNLPFADGTVFRASRLSRGNRLFPTQVAVKPTSVVHYTPHWIGAHEHSIHMAHVASVRVDSKMLFADVFIETTGGTGGIRCTGHRKADADLMKLQIERYQSEYYRSVAPHTRPPVPS